MEEDLGFDPEDGADADALDQMEENADFITADLFSGGFSPDAFYSLLDCDVQDDTASVFSGPYPSMYRFVK